MRAFTISQQEDRDLAPLGAGGSQRHAAAQRFVVGMGGDDKQSVTRHQFVERGILADLRGAQHRTFCKGWHAHRCSGLALRPISVLAARLRFASGAA